MRNTIPKYENAGGQDEKKRIAGERYIGGDVSLKELAAELGLSASTLGNGKRRETGTKSGRRYGSGP